MGGHQLDGQRGVSGPDREGTGGGGGENCQGHKERFCVDEDDDCWRTIESSSRKRCDEDEMMMMMMMMMVFP